MRKSGVRVGDQYTKVWVTNRRDFYRVHAFARYEVISDSFISLQHLVAPGTALPETRDGLSLLRPQQRARRFPELMGFLRSSGVVDRRSAAPHCV